MIILICGLLLVLIQVSKLEEPAFPVKIHTGVGIRPSPNKPRFLDFNLSVIPIPTTYRLSVIPIPPRFPPREDVHANEGDGSL